MATATPTRNRPTEAAHPALYRPAEVAKILDCSEWWIKEQARKRRIPYAWIGGSYRFTERHIADIIRLFEVITTSDRPSSAAHATAAPRRQAETGGATVTPLKARTPPRARFAHIPAKEAA